MQTGIPILQVNRFPPPTEERMGKVFRVERWPDSPKDRARLIAGSGKDIRGIATASLGPVDAALIGQLPALKIVACFSVGVDGIDTAFAQSRGIKVTNSGSVVADDVADIAVGLMLALRRGMRGADAFVRNGEWTVIKGQWSNGNFPLGHSMRGRRVGLIGLGRIGATIARRLAGFEVEVAYTARSAHPDTRLRYFSSTLELAGWSDILVACCPGGAATRHLVNGDVLRALGRGGFIINVSRGSVVDEAALIAALETGQIAGAGLDVFEHEPKVPEAIRNHPDVFLLPHMGSATEETRRAMGDSMIDALLAELAPAAALVEQH